MEVLNNGLINYTVICHPAMVDVLNVIKINNKLIMVTI